MLFIVFDIEIVFLYPLAVQLEVLGWFGFVELLVFVAILGVAYVYIWRKGALNGARARTARWSATAAREGRAQVRARALAGRGPGSSSCESRASRTRSS